MSTQNEPTALEIATKTARLARLYLPAEDLEKVAPQLEKILDMFKELQELDTQGVEPLANVIGENLGLRKDEVTDGNCQDKVLSNATESTQGFYSVPKVVE